jgi:RNA polymerase sigma-70 factor (ECF subfamily)
MTGQHSDADDVSQEAFVRAYRGLGTFDGRADFYTWLHRIVVNVALNHLRSRRRSRLTLPQEGQELEDLPNAQAGPSVDPRAQIESKEVMRAVVQALGELSPSLRVTLILATVEDMPYKEIAVTLGCPEGTVAWRVNQARKVLRQKLAALGATDQSPEELDAVLRRTKEALGAN